MKPKPRAMTLAMRAVPVERVIAITAKAALIGAFAMSRYARRIKNRLLAEQ